MPTFTPVDSDPFATPAPALAGGATLTAVDHDPFAAAPAATAQTLTPVDHDPFAATPDSTGADVAKSAGVGLVKGTTGLLGTPGNLSDALGNASEYVLQRGLKWAGALPDGVQPQSYADIAAENAKLSQGTNVLPRSSDYDALVQDAAGPYRQPQTKVGEYAQTIGEFAPSAVLGGGGAVERAVGGVLVPAVASETAGQLTKGTSAEPYARFMAALAGNAGAAGVSAYTSAPTRAVTEALGDVTPAQLAAARDLQATGARIGVPLSGPEAIQQATGGATKLGDLLRFTEGTQRGGAVTAPFFAQRPAQVAAAGNTAFDAIAPASTTPSLLGPQSAALAQQALEASPEGQALRSALNAVGPQTSAADAGNVIQPALRGVYDQRAQVRADQADADYGAARAAPADTDVATLPQYAAPPVRSPSYRYDTDEDGYALVPNSGRAPPAYPLAGPDRTGMVQLDPRQIAGHIDGELQTAKGTTATALRQVRGMLATNGGLDTSVEGVGNVRNAVNTMISTAQRNGDGPTAQSLTGVRDQIDNVLSDVPAYETARANYAQNSVPLRPFEDPALGKVIAQDGFGSLFTTSPDAVPQALQSGGTRSAAAFNQVATPAARTAYDHYLGSKLLNSAGGPNSVDSGRLSDLLRDNADVLSGSPGLRQRLENVIATDADIADTRQGALGQVSRAGSTQQAYEALIPQKPLVGSQGDIGGAVGALSAQDPAMTAALLRQGLADRFDQATTRLVGGDNQGGGANFAKSVAGTAQQRANLDAAVGALPNGPQATSSLNDLLDVLSATGRRRAPGSNTTADTAVGRELSIAPLPVDALKAVRTLGTSIPGTVAERSHNFWLDRRADALGNLFISPDSVGQITAMAARGAPAPYTAAGARTLTAIPSIGALYAPQPGQLQVYDGLPPGAR